MPTELKIGEVYYLKRVSVYHQCTLRSLHEYKSTAKVDCYADGEPVICRQSELLTEAQYKAVLRQRAKEAYERDLPLRQNRAKWAAKAKYAELVRLWEQGKRLHDLVKLWNETPRGVGAKIAAAKRWGLLKPDDEVK